MWINVFCMGSQEVCFDNCLFSFFLGVVEGPLLGGGVSKFFFVLIPAHAIVMTCGGHDVSTNHGKVKRNPAKKIFLLEFCFIFFDMSKWFAVRC